jgi:hypothetical protein
MRIFKVIVLLVILLVAGFFAYVFVIYPANPATWYSSTRRESVRILAAAQSTSELTNAVGYLGWFVQLPGHAWIAIRYRDTHSGFVGSSAVARDSSGEWFESDRHFCGRFQYWPRLKDQVQADEEMRKAKPEWFTNSVPLANEDGGHFPSFRELMAIESAPDLESARRGLEKIGFRKLKP